MNEKSKAMNHVLDQLRSDPQTAALIDQVYPSEVLQVVYEGSGMAVGELCSMLTHIMAGLITLEEAKGHLRAKATVRGIEG